MVWDGSRSNSRSAPGMDTLLLLLSYWYAQQTEHSRCWAGKGWLLTLISGVLGSYYCAMSKDCVVKAGKASAKGAHTDYIAKLQARRVAGRDELAAGAQLDEGLVSQLTGGGLVDTRAVGKGSFDFRPTHLPIVMTHHLPSISGRTEAIRRRVRVLPFDVSFKEAHEYDENDSLIAYTTGKAKPSS